MSSLTKRGKVIIGLCFVYLILQIQDFRWGLDNRFIYALGKFSVFIALLILIVGIPANKWFKMLYTAIYLSCVMLSYSLNLWEISAKAYLRDHQPIFTQVAKSPSLKSKDYISLSVTDLKSSRDTVLSKIEREQMKYLFNNTSVMEIESTSNGVLFIFDRFIDNGYGFLYLNNPKILTTERPRVIYDLTRWVPLAENWYYVSFT